MASPYLLLTILVTLIVRSIASAAPVPPRCIMYLTGQHPVVPDNSLTSPVTHVALAFMQSGRFNEDEPDQSWPLFMSVAEARSKFRSGTHIMVAIGGWGDTLGFDAAARTEKSRQRFATNVAAMVEATGADGVDVDWEYPGGNGEDYKRVPNSQKAWEIDAYPLLLAAIRNALGPNKIMSAAVPGLPRDMLAFTTETMPSIMSSLDFLNVMTYDLMNRRDNVTKHHTGVRISLEAIDAYIAAGARPQDINLGFAFYVKFFRTQHQECLDNPVGCPTGPMEDPKTGDDLGRTGGFSWHDSVPTEVQESFDRALSDGKYDLVGGGHYYWDEKQDLWWTFDTPDVILRKFSLIVQPRNLGGVFAWGLGEDAPEFRHLKAVGAGIKKLTGTKDEL